MKHILTVVCCLSLCSIAVLAQNKGAEGPAMSDQEFVNFAAQTDMVEANLGQLAQSAAASQSVRDYAQMLVTDHTNDFHQLSGVARQAGFSVPGAIDAEHNKTMIGPFQKLKGVTFDHRYIKEMIDGHSKGIAIYKKEAADARNPALKSYADQALSVLEKHLAGAKNLEKARSS